MADYSLPKANTAYVFYTALVSQADTKLLKSAPTLAAGDFKVSTDGAAFANLATLPTNTPSGTAVKISLSASEMNGSSILVTCIDATGAEWCDQAISIQTSAVGIEDINTRIGVAGAGLTDLGGMSTTMKAQVNTEVLDVLNVDTFAEVGQESPAATTTIRKMLGYVYKFLRNKKTQTATTTKLFADDATTVDQKSTVSDDGTTFTSGEFTTGP